MTNHSLTQSATLPPPHPPSHWNQHHLPSSHRCHLLFPTMHHPRITVNDTRSNRKIGQFLLSSPPVLHCLLWYRSYQCTVLLLPVSHSLFQPLVLSPWLRHRMHSDGDTLFLGATLCLCHTCLAPVILGKWKVAPIFCISQVMVMFINLYQGSLATGASTCPLFRQSCQYGGRGGHAGVMLGAVGDLSLGHTDPDGPQIPNTMQIA